MNEEVRRWVLNAESDWGVTNVLSANEFPNQIYFHAQQAIEKLFKALLTQNSLVPPKTHDLPKLSNLLNTVLRDWTWPNEVLETLTDGAVEVRYAAYDDPSPSEALGVRSLASRLRAELLRHLQPAYLPDLQALCLQGSQALQSTDYTTAEKLLAIAEQLAYDARDFDTLSRLYYPLQEARRQKRQRCGEGTIQLSLPNLPPHDLARQYPHGQFLLAAPGSTQPAEQLRALYYAQGVGGGYAETFLAASFTLPGDSLVIAILPYPADLSSIPSPISLDQLPRHLPPHSLLLPASDLLAAPRKGSPATFARTMALWESLHRPYLAQADAMPVSLAKLDAYRKVIQIDYACELAHQNAAQTARELLRAPRNA